MTNTRKIDTSKVTEQQLSLTHRIVDDLTGEVFYKVESERGLVDDEGNVVEYKVTYDAEHGFRCTCPEGREGFIHCKRYTVCKHVVWSLAAAEEFKREARMVRLMEKGLTEVEAREAVSHILIVDGKPADDETLVRVFGPHTRRPSQDEIERDARAYEAQKPFWDLARIASWDSHMCP